MEVLFELLFQLFFEVFGELIFTAITKVIGLFFKNIEIKNKLRNRIKFVLAYILIGLIITLITFALINSNKFLVVISLSYMLFQVTITLVEIILKDVKDNPTFKVIKILKKISHYVYPVLLIIFSSLYLMEGTLLTSIIVGSSLTLFIWLFIDIYKIWKIYKK